MAVSVVMPALEMAQETGKVVAWRKQEGDTVKKGEILLEVETDKAVVEIEASAEGILGGVSARDEDVVPVGQTIAWLLKPGEPVPAASKAQASGRKMDGAAAAAATAAPTPAPAAPVSVAGAKISPKARRLAREHGVDITVLRGSGPNGEILANDIMAAAKAAPAAAPASPAPALARPATPPPAVPAGDPAVVTSIGRIMAERTTQSWTTVPHFFVSRDVDATVLNATRARILPGIEQSYGVKVTHTDLLVAAVAKALRQHERMNGSWVDNTVRLNRDVSIALAMAVENAVVTAVIHKADLLTVPAIAQRRKELADRARAGKLQPADITGATFTISNLGMFSVDAFTAIIVPPQAGILAVGAIADRVVAVDGMIAVRPTMNLTLSSDHRVIDGARAAQFLNDVVQALARADAWAG